MTSKDKAFKLIQRIRELVRNNHTITFMDDVHGEGLTVYIDSHHFHTYNGKVATDEDILNSLFENLKWPSNG